MITTMMLVLELAANVYPVALLFSCCCFRHAVFRCAVSVATMMIMVIGSEVTGGYFPLLLVITAPR